MAFGQYLGIITGVIGAIIGGVLGGIGTYGFGAPAGAAWGFTIGSMIGGIAGQVFWPEKSDINTPPPPQPHETRLQFSSWGMAIPIQYGSGRMAGNIIYLGDIVETIERSRHRQDGVRYYEMVRTYTATFAIAFCEGPVESISRIWMNNKVIADWRTTSNPYYPVGDYGLAAANLATTIARSTAYFSVYLGSETQVADTAISTLLTAAEVPAYRGIAYIVFRDFPIGEFSGVPTIEIEVGPAELGYVTISFIDWSELDIEYVSEDPADFLTLTSDGFEVTDAYNAFTSAYSYSNPFGSAAVGKVRFHFTLSGFSGSGTDTLNMLYFTDATGSAWVSLVLGIDSVGFYIYRSGLDDSHSYSSVSFPFSRYVELDFTTAGTMVSKIYTDSGFSILEDTLTISGTGIAANPLFTYGGAAQIENASSLNYSLVVDSFGVITA
jgi:hypothetical protein